MNFFKASGVSESEAVLSRIVRVQGQPMVVPPFHAPDEQQTRTWLAQTGLPEEGM